MHLLTQGPVKWALISYLAGAVIVFSPVAAIKANWAQAVTRLQAVASLRVVGMQFSGNQTAARSVEVQRVTAETAG
jgi:hypothetical protein